MFINICLIVYCSELSSLWEDPGFVLVEAMFSGV